MATDDVRSRVLDEVGAWPDPTVALPVDAIDALIGAHDDAGPMSIAEVAAHLGLSAHSIRYYERAGLLTVPRDGHGHRTYDADVRRRLVFITRMRLSGMPMRDLTHYVDLVDQGDATIPERLDLMVEHRDTLIRQIRELTLSLAATEYKIATYGGAARP